LDTEPNAWDDVAMRLDVDRRALRAYCERWHVKELSFFGSVLRDDFGAESDVDVLVVFDPGAHPGLGLVTARSELSGILGRPVDLVVRDVIERDPNWIRRKEILETAEVVIGG
jgi:predicted nucleotidyltransferase